jgi:spore coat polysaccharide biosynthesis predicted glycosyltransferase SpsG
VTRPDLLLVDSYDAGAWHEVAALPHGLLVAFEDALPDGAGADATIASSEDAEAPGLVLGGLRYACLRRPYWEVGPRTIEDPPRAVLVTTGGSDLGGLASRLAAALRDRLADAYFDRAQARSKSNAAIEVRVVWAPAFAGEVPGGVTVVKRPPSLLGPLLGADAAVCTGGQTLLEAAATGTPTLALEGAPNQRPQIAGLAARGAVLPIEEDGVPEAMERLLGSPSRRRDLCRRAQQAVDGRGALRLAAELAAMSNR